jgi:5-methyltetrahydropteroyltriglutamate--homocysteine methyltransferase
VLSAIQGENALHLCFGNYEGQTIQRCLWKDMIAFLNNLKVDHLVLEFALRGYEELPLVNELDKGIALGLGVIDIKDNGIESPELVARRIERAVSVLVSEQVKWAHPDCDFWMLPRSIADGKMAALVRGRDLFLGQG